MSKLSAFLATTAAALALGTAAHASDAELTVFDWAGWDIAGAYAQYSAKHGDAPTYAFFGDDDEAFQKVSSGFQADIAHPCAASVPRYRDAGLIEPWDTTKIAAFGDIPPHLLNSSVFKDDQGLWFVPLDYAYTAIAYNTNDVKPEEVASLQVFKDPKFAGRISLPDSSDDVWSLAFLATGVTSWDNVTDEQFAAAAAWLREVHPNVRAYWADPAEMTQLMASGEVQVAWSWNDGVALLQAENFAVGYNRTPKEGAATWLCGYVNMKDAPGNEDKIYDFVNSVMSDEGTAAVVENIGYATSNAAAMAKLPAETIAKAYLDPLPEGSILFMQSPTSAELRAKMIEEFELIKTGF